MKDSSKPFTARFGGTCPECGFAILADVDEIVMRDSLATHLECDESADDPLVTFPI